MLVATIAETSPTDIANGESFEEEIKDPAPDLSKTMEGAGRKTVEIGITLASDEDAVFKHLSSIKPQENLPAPSLSRELELRAPSREEAPDHAAIGRNRPMAENVIDPKNVERACCEKPASTFSQRALAPIAKAADHRQRSYISPLALLAALIAGFGVRAQFHEPRLLDAPTQWNVKTLVDQIVLSESQGNPAAKNLNSSAMGLGQFVDGTWLDLVKRHRPDIAASRNEKQILELREDPELSRFMTGRYVEQNMSMLAKRGLPVTPASLYLAHFAGPGGAAAILAAPENADAATVIANVDRRPGVTREKIVSGNPFMKNFTAKDLRNWADLKMQRLKFNASAGDEKSAPRTN